MSKLFVLCALDRDDNGRATVLKFGPTSERADLLASHDWRHPYCYTTAVLPVMDGVLLRVSQRDADRAVQ